MVVYEWLCGAPPFTGSALEVAMQHVTAPVPPLRVRVPTLSPAVEQVVLTALAKDPAQRFADITAFATALERVLLPTQADHQAQPVPEQPSHGSPLPYLGRQHQRPLVGRAQQWERLRQLLLEIEADTQSLRGDHPADTRPWATPAHPSCALLFGEAGIGKTRLAEELSREAAARGWAVLWSRGYAQESGIPYQLWIELLRHAIQQRLWQPEEGRLSPRLARSLPVLSTLVPELAELLPQPSGASAGAPGQEQLQLWEGMLALLTTISERQPLLIVLDDLQWADGSSGELLSYLIRRLAGQRTFLVGTCRESDLPPMHPLRALSATLQREALLSPLHIPTLTEAEIDTLVAHVPAPLIPQIQRQAAGNPFFAEELARVSCAEDKTPPAGPPSTHRGSVLPDSITAVLDLRLGKLSSTCQRFLSRAAVLGDSFELNTVRSLEGGGSDPGRDRVLDLLEEALQAGILSEEGSGTRITYHFWHPLLVSHLYEGLSAGRRAGLHHRAAEVLQQTYQGREEEAAAAIAYHLVEGGADSPQIVYYAELAGDRAYALSAYPEAVRHYRLAVEQTGVLPPDASAGEQLHLANVLERLGECTWVRGNCEEARSYFERALAVRSRYRLSASQSDPQYEAQIDAMLQLEIGKTWFVTGHFEDAQQQYRRAEQVLCEAGVGSGPAWASLHLQQSYLLWMKGSVEEARQTAIRALELFESALQQQNRVAVNTLHPTATILTLRGDPVDLGRAHLLLGNIATVVGHSREALHHLNTALTIFERYDRQRELAIVCGNLGDLYLRQAEQTLAQAALRRSLSIAECIGEVSIMAVAFGNLGVLSARRGDLREAEASYQRGRVLAEQIHDPVYVSLLSSYLAMALLDQGRIEEAKVAVHQALTIGRASSIAQCIGYALVALGRLRITQALAGQEDEGGVPAKTQQQGSAAYRHFLQRARAALQRALGLEGLEAETRGEGQVILAQAAFLLGELERAQQQTMQVLEETHRSGQTWLLPSAQRLLGSILGVQGQDEQAELHLLRAMEVSQQCGMRLEYARSLQQYGMASLQRSTPQEVRYQQGLSHLREARQLFIECRAALDLQVVERMLMAYCETSTQEKVPV